MGMSIKALIAALPAARRSKIEREALRMAEEMIEKSDSLVALRKAHGKTQAQVAQTLGINQNAVSQLENRTDVYVSTLQKYLKALGVELEIALRTREGTRIVLPNFRPWAAPELALSAARKPRPSKVASAPTNRAKKPAKSTKARTGSRVVA